MTTIITSKEPEVKKGSHVEGVGSLELSDTCFSEEWLIKQIKEHRKIPDEATYEIIKDEAFDDLVKIVFTWWVVIL